jgi:hypothetical protein
MFADQPKKREKRIERRTLEKERRGGEHVSSLILGRTGG